MRFPLPLTAKIAAYVIGHKLRGTKKFATVLQLEPLHTCNLTCTGCGRIREYSTSLKDMMSLEDCLGAANECNAPMVSICGGEPLIYPHIEALVDGLLGQRRIVYICTNAMFMRKKMREWMASQVSIRSDFVEEKISALLGAGLSERKRCDRSSQRTKRSGKANYWSDQMDVLERASRWLGGGINACAQTGWDGRREASDTEKDGCRNQESHSVRRSHVIQQWNQETVRGKAPSNPRALLPSRL